MDKPIMQPAKEPLQTQSSARATGSASASAIGSDSAGAAGLASATSRRKSGIWLPIILFIATCLSTFWAAGSNWWPYAHLDNLDRAFWAFWQNAPQGSWSGALHESLGM
ncbi:MAG: hypothetical protein ABSE63_11455, partial [Thermoguttaceae bacterium]